MTKAAQKPTARSADEAEAARPIPRMPLALAIIGGLTVGLGLAGRQFGAPGVVRACRAPWSRSSRPSGPGGHDDRRGAHLQRRGFAIGTPAAPGPNAPSARLKASSSSGRARSATRRQCVLARYRTEAKRRSRDRRSRRATRRAEELVNKRLESSPCCRRSPAGSRRESYAGARIRPAHDHRDPRASMDEEDEDERGRDEVADKLVEPKRRSEAMRTALRCVLFHAFCWCLRSPRRRGDPTAPRARRAPPSRHPASRTIPPRTKPSRSQTLTAAAEDNSQPRATPPGGLREVDPSLPNAHRAHLARLRSAVEGARSSSFSFTRAWRKEVAVDQSAHRLRGRGHLAGLQYGSGHVCAALIRGLASSSRPDWPTDKGGWRGLHVFDSTSNSDQAASGSHRGALSFKGRDRRQLLGTYLNRSPYGGSRSASSSCHRASKR